MAKSKPDKRNQKRKKTRGTTSSEVSPEMAQSLLEQATALLQTGQADQALQIANKALNCLTLPHLNSTGRLPVLELLGAIHIELGEPDEARTAFEAAVELDPDGHVPEEIGGGADKFLWLAQLSEEGGADSVKWFDKGCSVLRQEIGILEDGGEEEAAMVLDFKKTKLANALCGAAEVYMTDLSWEADAEARCENLVTEACLAAPWSPEPLQTLASVRLSQTRFEDARSALQRSLDIWKDLGPEDPGVPDFPTRISLSRLLMEADLEDKAIDVLERLVAEDDSSVEAWYLGGWCLHLLAHKGDEKGSSDVQEASNLETLRSSRKWLLTSLRLYASLGYEDERLYSHAQELVKGLERVLGPTTDQDEEDEDDWEDGEDEMDSDNGNDNEMTTV